MVGFLFLCASACVTAQAEDGDFTFTQPLVEAADNGDVATVGALLTQGTSPDVRAQFGVTALMRAAYRGHESVAKLLLQAGADVNAVDQGGATALHVASRQGRTILVNLLLGAHADVNATDDNSWTPLMRATMGRHLAIVKALLKAKANMLVENRWKQNTLDILAQSGNAALLQLYEQALQGKTLPTNVSTKMEQYAKWNPDTEFREKVTAFAGKQVSAVIAELKQSVPSTVEEVDVTEKVEVLPVLSLEDKPNVPQDAPVLPVTPAPAVTNDAIIAENTLPVPPVASIPVVKADTVIAEDTLPVEPKKPMPETTMVASHTLERHISSYPPEMRSLVEQERKKGKSDISTAITPAVPSEPALPVIALPTVQDFAVESAQIQEAKAEIQLNPAPVEAPAAPAVIPEAVPVVPLIASNTPDPGVTIERRATTLYAKERSKRTNNITAYEATRHEPRRHAPPMAVHRDAVSHNTHNNAPLMQPVETAPLPMASAPIAMAPLMEANPPMPAEMDATPLPVLLDMPTSATVLAPTMVPAAQKILSLPTPKRSFAPASSVDSIAMAPLMDVNLAPVTQVTVLPIIEEDGTMMMPQQSQEQRAVPTTPKKSSLIQVAKPIRVAKGQPVADTLPAPDPAPSMATPPSNIPFGPASKALPPPPSEHVMPKPMQKQAHDKGHHPHKKAVGHHAVSASDQLIYPLWITSAYFANAELAGGVVDALMKMPEMAAYQIWVVELSGDAGYGLRIGSFSTKSSVKETCGTIRRLRHLKTPMQGSCMLEVQQADRSFVPAQSVAKR